MKNNTRLISAILAAVLCGSSLAACANNPTPPVTDVTTDTPITIAPATEVTTDAPTTIAPVTTVITEAPDTVAPVSTGTADALGTEHSEVQDTSELISDGTTGTPVTTDPHVTTTDAPDELNGIENGFEWRNNNGKIIITNYMGNENVVIIPDSINNKPVTEIGYEAFYNRTFLKEVYIPDTVTRIRGSAFKNCSALQKVSLSDDLVSIGDSCFSNCLLLKDISLPDSLRSIGYSAFSYCKSLEKIRIPNGVKSLSETFKECSSLGTIEIPDSIESISLNAFYKTKWVEKVLADGPVIINGIFLGYLGDPGEPYTIPKEVKCISGICLSDKRCPSDVHIIYEAKIDSYAFEAFKNNLTVDMTLSAFEIEAKGNPLCNTQLSSLTILKLPKNRVQLDQLYIGTLIYAEGITEVNSNFTVDNSSKGITAKESFVCGKVLLPSTLSSLNTTWFYRELNRNGTVELNCSPEDSALTAIPEYTGDDPEAAKAYYNTIYELSGPNLRTVLNELGYK